MSAAGVAGSVALDATGVGAVVGVPLGGLSALGVATGVGIAGVAGASIVNDALGPDRVDVTTDDGNASAADTPSETEVGQDVRIAEDSPELLVDRQQIEKKYEAHAADFGVEHPGALPDSMNSRRPSEIQLSRQRLCTSRVAIGEVRPFSISILRRTLWWCSVQTDRSGVDGEWERPNVRIFSTEEVCDEC